MRVKHSLGLAVALLPCHWAVGQGLQPRSSPGDYPVYQDSPSAAIAAVRLKPDQVGKTFSSDVEKYYVVVEVAVYPKNGAPLDVRLLDFALRFGGEQETLPDTPEDASLPWREKSGIKERVAVTEEAGVFVATQKDPATGRRTTSTGAYEATGVAVGGPQGQSYPDPPKGPDPRVVADRLKARALPEGKTSRAVAGYLYFPQPPKKPKNPKLELTYSSGGSAIALIIPGK